MVVLRSSFCRSTDHEKYYSLSSHHSSHGQICLPLLESSSDKLASLQSTSGNSANQDLWPGRSIEFYWRPCFGKQSVVLLQNWCWAVLPYFPDRILLHQTTTASCCKLDSRNHSGTTSQQDKSNLFNIKTESLAIKKKWRLTWDNEFLSRFSWWHFPFFNPLEYRTSCLRFGYFD